MGRILILLHTEADGSLARSAFEALSAANQLARNLGWDDLVITLVGKEAGKAISKLGGFNAKQFLTVEGADFEVSRYATDAFVVEQTVKYVRPEIVIAPGTSRFNRSVPGAIYRVGGRTDTHVCGLEVKDGRILVTRWVYRQRIETTITRTIRPWALLIETGAFQVLELPEQQVNYQSLLFEVPADLKNTTPVEERQVSVGPQTIRPDADLLFVAGAGWTKKQADGQVHLKEAEELIWEFLQLTGASLGSTKSLVDLSSEGQAALSFLTHLNQVGQTGSTPRHRRGLATCCHGEEPHTVGWRFIQERRAINLDPNCGWARGKADVLYVADAFAVIRKVNELLKQVKK